MPKDLDELTLDELKKVNKDAPKKAKAKAKKKKDRRKKPPKLPNKVVRIKNSEKDTGWMESWDVPKNRKIGDYPHPYRMILSAGTGVGKTMTAKNILLQKQSGSRPFDEVYICTCSMDNHEWNDIEPTGIMTDIPLPSMFDPKKRTLLIFDDRELLKLTRDEQNKISTLFRHTSTHRSVSIMLLFQSWFDIAPIAKKCSNVFIFWKPRSSRELTLLSNSVGLEPEDIHELFETQLTSPYDSLCVDMTVGTKWPLRKNVFEPILNKDGECKMPSLIYHRKSKGRSKDKKLREEGDEHD